MLLETWSSLCWRSGLGISRWTRAKPRFGWADRPTTSRPSRAALCAKTLAHGGKSEEELATDVEMYWHVVAAYLEAGLTDEPGREIGD